jgi:hypothetical protein
MGASTMSDQPILSGEFNAAMDGLRRTLGHIEKSQDAMNARIDDLTLLHRTCTARREAKAFSDGLEAGKVKTLAADVAELKEDKKISMAFRRSFIGALAVSLLASLFAMVRKI